MKTRNCSSIVNGYAIINSTEGIKNIGKDRSKTLFRDIITWFDKINLLIIDE